MQRLFLIPPSEGKNSFARFDEEKLSFNFSKPLEIAINATEKDLKCTWKRYQEWIDLNKKISKARTNSAIEIYTGSMYKAIDYQNMSFEAWKFFENNFLILSWMYGLLRPLDRIGNYKLPIETKWLYDFHWDKIAQTVAMQNAAFIVNLLPNSYAKLIWIWKTSKQKQLREIFEKQGKKIINIEFFQPNWAKFTHWVKKVRWDFINQICKQNHFNYKDYDFSENDWMINLKIICWI